MIGYSRVCPRQSTILGNSGADGLIRRDWHWKGAFVALQNIIAQTLTKFDGKILNECEEMADINPSAEKVSEFFYYSIREKLPVGVSLDRVVLRRTGGALPEAEYVFSES